MAFVLYFVGYVSDLMSKEKMTFTFIRKLFCCFGLVSQSFFMLIMILSNDTIEIIICLMLAVGFGGMTWASFGVNHLDIGAGYANVLMAISNTFATLPGIISPILTGHIINEKVLNLNMKIKILRLFLIFFLSIIRPNQNGTWSSGYQQ